MTEKLLTGTLSLNTTNQPTNYGNPIYSIFGSKSMFWTFLCIPPQHTGQFMTLNPSETSVCTEWKYEIWFWYFTLNHKHKKKKKKYVRYLFTWNQFGPLRCSCFIEINFIESENASDSLTIYCPTMVEPKTKGLNSYDPEYCLYNMNRLKPHPKY